MTRFIRLLLALALVVPVVGACSMDPNGPDISGGTLCGSAAVDNGSCPENLPETNRAR